MSKILIVDDEIAYNELLKDYLESHGYSVVCAFDGKQGLELYHQEKPDLIITDIVMPDMDGIELLLKLTKKDDKFPCKVIAISGGGRINGGGYLATSKMLGADQIFEKPFKMEDLRNCIESIMP
ncbi:MAG: response regulator [Alteromonadaceae bacterium]|nr:MAG: response regulator [Alteromonadaceae bacterium]